MRVCACLLVLFLSMSHLTYACDSTFLHQEPTTREPDSVEVDTIAGFLYATYAFLDGRTLVTVYQLPEATHSDEIITTTRPLFYILKNPGHVDLVWSDPEGQGHCWEIERYH